MIPTAIATGREVLRDHHVDPATFRAYARVIASYAGPDGRRCIARRDTIANLMNFDVSTVKRCLRTAGELGVVSVVVRGRMLTLAERLVVQGRTPQRGLANELARCTPSLLPHDPPSSGEPYRTHKCSYTSSSFGATATNKAAPPAPRHRRKQARPPAAAYALARELKHLIPWLEQEPTGRLAPALTRFATASPRWSGRDIVACIDAHNLRMGWTSLTRSNVRTRPAAALAYYLRDLDIHADHPRGLDPLPQSRSWCGTCDHPTTRLIDAGASRDTVAPCPRCHPRRNPITPAWKHTVL
ncbi:MAG: hypothetical protein ACRDP4_01315 [Nocardioidaceae bacterium]